MFRFNIYTTMKSFYRSLNNLKIKKIIFDQVNLKIARFHCRITIIKINTRLRMLLRN